MQLYLSLHMAIIFTSPLSLELLVALGASEVLLEIGPGEFEAFVCAAISDPT